MEQQVSEVAKTNPAGILEAAEPVAHAGRPKRRATIPIVLTLTGVIAGILGVAYYRHYVAPFSRAVITVDDRRIEMRYFLKRARLTGFEPLKMLEILAKEELIRRGAPPLVGGVAPEEVEGEVKKIAAGEGRKITGREAEEWYRQQLGETGLSDAEYREILATHLLAARLHAYLAQRVPTVGKQVRLEVLAADTVERAEKLKARWTGGEKFSILCRDAAQFSGTGKGGGDLGWISLDAGITGFEGIALRLDAGEVSDPVRLRREGPVFLVRVSERAEARALDEESLQALRARAVEDWLSRELARHDVKYNFNSEIHSWVKTQLAQKK